MFERLKSAWKKMEYRMAAHDVMRPPPEELRKEMENLGWKYETYVHSIGVPMMVAPPVTIYIKSPEGDTIRSDNPEVYQRYREDLRCAAYRVYGI